MVSELQETKEYKRIPYFALYFETRSGSLQEISWSPESKIRDYYITSFLEGTEILQGQVIG